MKNLIYILFIFSFINAQTNLVPNPSFEDTTHCPQGLGDGAMLPWETPTLNSPDFFHACNQGVGPNWNVSTPTNLLGTQPPKSGLAYAGFGTFSGAPNGREYIETNLLDTLSVGKKYCVRYFLNLCDSCTYASNSTGAYFLSSKYINYTTSSVLPFTPQVEFNSTILTDTLNWVELKKEFTAIGNERYIIIGSFANDSQTLADTLFSNRTWYIAYYYIDDVSVYESAEAIAGADTFVCNVTDSVQLGVVGRADLQYSWQPTTGLSNANNANPKAAPLLATTYTLTVIDTNVLACNSIYFDTVTVFRSCVGITEQIIKDRLINVYPNPANNFITIENLKLQSGNFIVVDLLGKVVLTTKLNLSKTTLDLSALKNGIYFYSYLQNEKEMQNGKLIVSH